MRYSLKSALAATRGARTATARAERRYARDQLTALLIGDALGNLNRAEWKLRQAMARVLASESKRRAA